ncbi:MAG: DUF6624 domain-containing protein [Acidobacteriota bacterium]
MIEERLRLELLQMREADQAVRAELAADGSLFDGYHPRMEELHRRNAERLAEIIEQQGWPAISLVGEDGSDAAWMIAQHAIGEPAFQRRCLSLLTQAAADSAIPAWQPAYLEDRIRMFEDRPQLYGTQYDWDENGEMEPWPIEDEEHIDDRRLAIGLGALAENTARMREGVAGEKEQPPRDWARRRKEFDDWAHKTGWRD